MAKNLSVLGSQSGKVGNVVFRKTKYGTIVSQIRGSNQSWFRSSSEAVRTRENTQEFSALIRLTTSLKKVFAALPMRNEVADFTQRYSHLLAPLKNLDTDGERGRRNYSLSRNSSILRGMSVGKVPFTSALPISITATRSGSTVTFNVPAFTPAEIINAPAGATHFRIGFVVGSVSDFAWVDDENDYAPANAAADMRSSVSLTDIKQITTAAETATTQAVSNPVASLDSATLVAGVFIIFYQRVSGTNYMLQEGKAATIIDAWDGGNE